MKEYHKIDSVYKRDEKGKFLIGEFSRPEFEYLKDNPWLWTEKIDGTNIRVQYECLEPLMDDPDPMITFGGKTDNAQIPVKLISYLEDTFLDKHGQFMDMFGTASKVCLYGEGYGAGIQKGGGDYSPDQKFILFDVKIGDWWLQRKDVEDIAAKLSIGVVPLIHQRVTLTNMVTFVSDKATQLNEIPGIYVASILAPKAQMEGYVGTPEVPLFARNGDRIITKIKYKDFR